MLRSGGLEAWVLHRDPSFALPWLPDAHSTPRLGLESSQFGFRADDLLVVPEVEALNLEALQFPGQLLLFVQGSLPLLDAVPNANALRRAGFSEALATMPHLARLCERFYGLSTQLVPPYIADPFFADQDPLGHHPRERTVLLHVKEAIDRLGLPDRRMIEQFWSEQAPAGWQLERFSGLQQQEVAQRMNRTSLLVNLNLVEGFNATVAEAMASGCVTLTYDAIGGRDYLVESGAERNAFVYRNGDIVPLADQLFQLMHSWDDEATRHEIVKLQRNARSTALRFRRPATEQSLLQAIARFR